jgi:hypothetical protein
MPCRQVESSVSLVVAFRVSGWSWKCSAPLRMDFLRLLGGIGRAWGFPGGFRQSEYWYLSFEHFVSVIIGLASHF